MFLDRLSDEDFVDLVNLCNGTENYFAGIDLNDTIDLVLISNEDDRCLESGERYYWLRGVRRGDVPKFIGQYKATDFWMASCEPFTAQRDCTPIFREYMAKKFGTEYLDSLYEHNVASALAERKALEAKIGITR